MWKFHNFEKFEMPQFLIYNYGACWFGSPINLDPLWTLENLFCGSPTGPLYTDQAPKLFRNIKSVNRGP